MIAVPGLGLKTRICTCCSPSEVFSASSTMHLRRPQPNMRIKTAYVGDSLIDAAVLDTIIDPTPKNPFHAVSARWFVQSVSRTARLFSKPRSALYIEAMGKMTLGNDEVVGYRLMHSVSFPSAPPLPLYDRNNISICMLWRQSDTERVQTFVTSYLEIRENMLTSMIVRSVADPLLTPWKYIHVAQLKKLAWMTKRKDLFQDNEDRISLLGNGCFVCGSYSRSARQVHKASCAVCTKITCGSCRIKRELLMFAPDGSLVPHTTRFCVRCVAVANALDAAKIASEDANTTSERTENHDIRRLSEMRPTMVDPALKRYGLRPDSVETFEWRDVSVSSSSS